ncbi:two-component regulator propeller domain-containing protein [Pseudomarimonas salicorniae]|uniref:histidine kinase n=1 Tax=Pseudomarimonas salicorniae TaxID=2933270 RepID=A0ABT0GLS6_9GAMM|nr:ATP-binding protein [Lysobacter sp. CAU 1642]
MRVDSSLGLSQDSALSLAQDPRGYLWIGTQDGLNRWDGREMRVFRTDGRPGSIGSNWISSLLVDAGGRLWVGTSAGLFVHDATTETFLPADLDLPSDRHVYDLALARDGEVWTGSSAGLERWRAMEGADLVAEGALLFAPAEDPRVRAIEPDGSGRLWLAYGSGVHLFDPRTGSTEATPGTLRAFDEVVNDLLQDSRGRLWMAGDVGGVSLYDPQAESVRSPPALAGTRSYALAETEEGWLWIGTESTAIALEVVRDDWAPGDIHVHEHRPLDAGSVGRGRVRSLLSTDGEGIWLGTWDGGASGLHPERSRMLSMTPYTPGSEALRHPAVLALVESEGAFWLGTMDGVYRTDGSGLRPRLIPGSESISAYSLHVTADRILVGSASGLMQFNRENGTWQALTIDALRGARIRRLRQIDDALWLYAESRGLAVLDARTFDIREDHALPATIHHIQPVGDDLVVVSASNGLHWFSRDGREHRHLTPVDPSGDAAQQSIAGRPSSVLQDAEGRLWVTLYGAGLARMLWSPGQSPEAARFPLILAPPRLANAGVNLGLSDAKGYLWLATDRGISRFAPRSEEVVNFDRSDGALGRGYYYSAGADLGGRLFAAGSKDGYTLLEPGDGPDRRPARRPLLTAIEVDGRPLRVDGGGSGGLQKAPAYLDSWSLQAGAGRSLIFRFASPELLRPSHMHYRVLLEGFDPDWQQVDGARGMVAYGNLPPGHYILRLQAVRRSGEMSEVTSLNVHVMPFWWQTWPARIAAALILLLAGVLAYRARVTHLRQRQVELETRVAERTRAAETARLDAERALAELHSTQTELIRSEKLSALGQLVAGVAHEVNTPLGVVLTASSHLSGAIAEMRRRMEEGGISRRDFQAFLDATAEGSQLIQRNIERAADLVQSFKQVSVDRSSDGRRRFVLAQFLADLTTSLRPLWRHRPVTLRIDCDEELEMDSFPGALGQVLTNLVQNSLLHAFQGEVPGEMRIEASVLEPGRLRLRYADNGRGMSEATAARAFEPFFTTRRGGGGTGLGLHIVHNLVREKLGGSLRMDTHPDTGTRFEIDLPCNAP